MRVSA
jgi:DNA replication protein DnaC